ncbi:MAG: aldo/keto reductase [Deltaproteobacteria bacterium]
MKYRKLGSSDLTVSEIGFGCWAMGGGWGEVSDRDSVSSVVRAIDLGINFFDTADIYGFGHSEEVLAGALGSRRGDVVIATKGGLVWDDAGRIIARSGARDYLAKALEASLRRLNTDYVDLYQIHWPDSNTPLEETMRALEEFQKSGKARYVGVSNFTAAQMRDCLGAGQIHSLQPPYNMLMREAERELFPFCSERGIGVLAYGPLAYGLLTGKYTEKSEFPATDWRGGKLFPDPGEWKRHIDLFHGDGFRRNLEIVALIKGIAQKRGKTPGQVAIAWALAHPAVSCALVGARRPSQVEDNAAASGWTLPPEDMAKINDATGGGIKYSD